MRELTACGRVRTGICDYCQHVSDDENKVMSINNEFICIECITSEKIEKGSCAELSSIAKTMIKTLEDLNETEANNE